MLPRFAVLALALVACAPPVEQSDAAPDRRVSRTDAAPDAEPIFEDVFFPPSDAAVIDSASTPDSESDATTLDDGAQRADSAPDAQPDSAPDPRDAGSDARDAAPDVCPASGYMDVTTWAVCGTICCPSAGACVFDSRGQPYCN